MAKPNVFIVHSDMAYNRLFADNGWNLVDSLKKADLVQFTGGSDVSPKLYGESQHPTTSCSPERDMREQMIFALAKQKGLPMAGVCRGGQFLNVMSGGKMFQHVEGHAIRGWHEITDVDTNLSYPTTSTHHQMMRPDLTKGILVAFNKITKMREFMEGGLIVSRYSSDPDVEVVWYPDTKCLCFQPHPEYFDAPQECAEWYFTYINRYIGLKGEL